MLMFRLNVQKFVLTIFAIATFAIALVGSSSIAATSAGDDAAATEKVDAATAIEMRANTSFHAEQDRSTSEICNLPSCHPELSSTERNAQHIRTAIIQGSSSPSGQAEVK